MMYLLIAGISLGAILAAGSFLWASILEVRKSKQIILVFRNGILLREGANHEYTMGSNGHPLFPDRRRAVSLRDTITLVQRDGAQVHLDQEQVLACYPPEIQEPAPPRQGSLEDLFSTPDPQTPEGREELLRRLRERVVISPHSIIASPEVLQDFSRLNRLVSTQMDPERTEYTTGFPSTQEVSSSEELPSPQDRFERDLKIGE